MLEIVIAIVVLLVAALGVSKAILASGRAEQMTREADRATQAARRVLESIQAEPFAEAFRRYNANPADDPGGAGTAPGANFSVAGLTAADGDADGLAGEVIFPRVTAAPAELREDAVDAALGTPRDLDGDGVIDGVDHANDYLLLPVRVRVRWRSAAGPGVAELRTLIANY
jgi:type II secretory pathway pseudopilin PulG